MNSYHKTHKQMGASVFDDYPTMFETKNTPNNIEKCDVAELERKHCPDVDEFAAVNPVAWEQLVQATLDHAGKKHVYHNENKRKRHGAKFEYTGEKVFAPVVAEVAKLVAGYKIDKNRVCQNDVYRPSAGTIGGKIWAVFDEDSTIRGKDIASLAELYGWNVCNTSRNYYLWRKFNNLQGRTK